MVKKKCFIILLLQSFYLSLRVSCFQEANDAASVFIFNGSSGNDSLCMRQDTNRICRTLSVANTIIQTYHSNTRLKIQGNLKLMAVLQVKPDNSNVTLIGVPDTSGKAPVIECVGDAGIKVNGSSNFSIMHLSFKRCNVESDPTNPYGYGIAITLTQNVLLYKVNISNSPNSALYFENCEGNITLNSIGLNSNGHDSINSKYYYRYSKYYYHCAGLCITQRGLYRDNNQYFISYSNFKRNRYPYIFDAEKIGGAICIFLDKTSKNKIVFQNCSITDNLAVKGAGVYIELINKASYNEIEIQGSHFVSNSARYSGGALAIDYGTGNFKNKINVSYCQFVSNCGKFGGGTAITSGSKVHASNESNIVFSNCIWNGNYGILSSAIDMSLKYHNIDKMSYLPRVDINNSTIANNTLKWGCNVLAPENASRHHSNSAHKTSPVNSGVVVATRYTLHFGGSVNITNNYYTALVVASGVVEIDENSHVIFDGNIGYNGGAVGLFGLAQIILNYHQVLVFRNNYAHRKGGAIVYFTIDKRSILSGDHCFLKHNLKPNNRSLLQTTQVIFENNTSYLGDSVFAESFTGCFYECFGHRKHKNVYTYGNITNCFGNFSIPEKEYQFVSSGQLFMNYNAYDYKVIPGQRVKINCTVKDEFNQTLRPLTYITKSRYSYHNSVNIREHRTLNTKVTPVGQPGLSSSFSLSVIGVREIYFFFNITLLPCPPGFYLHNQECECASGTDKYKFIVGCHRKRAQFRVGLWVGYIPTHEINHTNLFFAPCESVFLDYPLHNNKEIQLLSTDPTNLNEHICSHNRMGVLCGKCVHNTSTFFHSKNYKCGKNNLCNFGWLFYLLSEVVPMVTFFVIAILFNISFTSGTAVGFVFFAQFLDKLTVHDIHLYYLRVPYRVFYGLFNFEFFEVPFMSFCLWHNSQVLDVIAMKYVTLSLALVLTLILLALLHKNYCSAICLLRSRVSANTSVFHGLCTFLVICYTQATKTSFFILKYTVPTGYNGIETQHPYSYYGGLKYLQDHHLVYAIPAFLVVALFTTLLPLVLLCYPLSLQLLSFCNLSEHKCVYYILHVMKIRKLIPYIDCFQSCYKDRYRFFAGLYFVYRILILICYTSNPQGYLFYSYSQLLLVTFLGIHCVIQPYKRRLHNILDALIFFNLSMINGFALVSEYFAVHILPGKSQYPTSIPLISNTLQLALLYIPMIVLLAILFIKTFKFIRNRKQKERQEIEVPQVGDIFDYDDFAAQKRLIESSRNDSYGSADC